MIAGLEITWQVAGADAGEAVLDRIAVAFERAGNELADFSKNVFPKLTPVFEAEMARQFDAEGGGPSGAWRPLLPAYARWKEEHYPGKTILRRTDDIFTALTQSSSPLAARVFSGDHFNFGTQGVPYASHHQVSLNARPIFDFSEDFESDLARAALDGAREAVAAAGLDEFVEVVP